MPSGLFPPDPSTELGRLRILLGDVSYTEGEGGQGEYAVFGDSELVAFLEEGNQKPLRAAAIATRRLALEYSAAGQSIRTDDIAIDLRSRGANLIEVAKSFQDEADNQDAYLGIGPSVRPGDGPDIFAVAPGRPLIPDWF